jgi:SAM-dependent methyltransferase
LVDVPRIEDVRRYWDDHAQRDPLWAILSMPDKKGRKWDLDAFFRTGIENVALVRYELERLGAMPARRTALDFGCGVGRLTQALAPHFDKVVGVDVSPRMIELASALNMFGDKVEYAANEVAHLRRFDDGTFDFILSMIVLQHLEPDVARGYLHEFVRILKPGGVMLFQLPSHPRPLSDRPPLPMPDDAYRVSIVASALPRDLEPGQAVVLHVEVTNTSSFTWSRAVHGPMQVGNHWLDATHRRMLLRDDGRTPLPDDMQPGQRCALQLTITAPTASGDYACEIDIAHEGLTWFQDKGSPTLRLHTRVGRPEDRQIADRSDRQEPMSPVARTSLHAALAQRIVVDAPDPGEFPMHSIHCDAIADLIAARGARLLHKEVDDKCGGEWVSYRYFVTKPI